MKKNTLKTLGIIVLSIAMLASTVAGCGSKETADVPATEVVEAVVETEVAEETEAAPEATEEVVVEDTEIAEVVEETEAAEDVPEFTVTDMSATKYAKQAVKVRKGPSTDYEQLGSLSLNQQVTVTGQADTGWYRIDFNGEVGYVSNNFLVDQRIIVSTPAQNTQNTQTQNQSTTTPADTTQAQTPVVDNSGWTGDASTSTPSTPSVDTSTPAPTPTPTPDASTSTPSTDTGSSDVTLDNWWETDDAPTFDPSTNPEVDGLGGGIF